MEYTAAHSLAASPLWWRCQTKKDNSIQERELSATSELESLVWLWWRELDNSLIFPQLALRNEQLEMVDQPVSYSLQKARELEMKNTELKRLNTKLKSELETTRSRYKNAVAEANRLRMDLEQTHKHQAVSVKTVLCKLWEVITGFSMARFGWFQGQSSSAEVVTRFTDFKCIILSRNAWCIFKLGSYEFDCVCRILVWWRTLSPISSPKLNPKKPRSTLWVRYHRAVHATLILVCLFTHPSSAIQYVWFDVWKFWFTQRRSLVLLR